MHVILALLIAIMVFCSFLLADAMIVNKKRRESLRARIAPDGSAIGSAYDDAMATTNLNSEISPRAALLTSLLRGLGVNMDDALQKIGHRFAQAGNNSSDAPIYYLFFQRIVSIFLLVLTIMVVQQYAHGTFKIFIVSIGILVGIIALFGPYLYLQNMISKRKKLLLRAFPDTLDLLLICVEAGLALDAALARVCNELGRAYPEMMEELNRTRLELALINDRVRALMNLGDRTDLVAFRSLTAALIQSERFGTSLTDTLRVLSEDFRLMRLTDAEAKAARLPVLLTIPLIFLLLPSFILVLLGPALISFIRNGQQVTGQ